ncbi:MAG: hypothetical protein GX330_04430 [Bacteroidales bacterium]|nr:hypothetical protein [Bacteroidales bacterium]
MKKIKFLLAIVCLLATTTVFSQDWSGYRVGELYPGYIIKTDGTKIEGYIEGQSRGETPANLALKSNQTQVIFYSDPKNKKSKVIYKPTDLTEYKIAEKVYRSINYSGGLTAKPFRFILLAQDGRIAKYMYYENEGSITYPDWKEKEVFQKGNEKPIEISSFAIGFSKKMSALVADNKELADKVANKEKGYGMLSIYEIIQEYNTWYAAQNSPQE